MLDIHKYNVPPFNLMTSVVSDYQQGTMWPTQF